MLKYLTAFGIMFWLAADQFLSLGFIDHGNIISKKILFIFLIYVVIEIMADCWAEENKKEN